MIGMWQIDEEEVRAKNFAIEHLGVCYSHFMYDQNQLHTSNLKQTKKYTESIIHRRRCLFCNRNKIFFSRSANCEEHSYVVIGKNIQVPCIGQKKCGALQEYHLLVTSIKSSEYAQYVCMDCYEKKGGHIYQRVGKGSHHQNDTKEALEAIRYWILEVATSEKLIWQEKILAALVPVLSIVSQEKTIVQNNKIEIPFLFMILIILTLAKFNYNSSNKLNSKNLIPKHFFEFGEALANSIILGQ
ncbi:hypothetical protein RirG_164550 [Rhizophagus irregularis DAOM 197198w]|uniref:Uncharacterized protein n=1 Tax=Rhizophagus irregularis (strain DAOM 197198w) TaxID=1432141 RepID=A0A015KQT9_RHIIW|nr:hypothetical protein RirG_164550 [Rhizophagus irregularis DAOM 197198w]